jgi:RNA polymerase sigma factor (sigma-70 family)
MTFFVSFMASLPTFFISSGTLLLFAAPYMVRNCRSGKMRTEDGCIIRECLNGKPEAFGVLVDKYKEGIYAFVYAQLQNFHDAQDVTQEVFVEAYRGLRSLRRWESFGFWIYRIARRRCLLWFRARSKRVDREFIEDQDPKVIDAPALDSYRVDGLSESVRDALNSLPETYREVLMLYYFGGMNSVDIAKALGTSPTAIRHRLSRARVRIREEMITMMDTAFEEHKLPSGFTFRIVEAVKRIKISPMPRMTGLPWGLSLAAGIAVVVMTLGSQMAIHQSPELTAFPGETETLKVREIAADILSGPQASVMAGKQGDTDGVGMDQRSPESNSLLAPAKGGGTWIQKADMPTARYYAGSAVVDGKIYVIGGASVANESSAVVEEYDPATDTWTRCADMPTARQEPAAAAVDGIIYAIGGWDAKLRKYLSTVEAYDPVLDEWTKKADTSIKRSVLSASAVAGKIYVTGGRGCGDPSCSGVEVYDPATNTWIMKTSMPTGVAFHAACVIDGWIYVFGGNTKWDGGKWPCAPTVQIYDPAANTWTQASDMPRTRVVYTASVVDGKMYIIGGGDEVAPVDVEQEDIEQSRIIDVYDPTTDTWATAADHPVAIGAHTAAVVDDKIYTIGGSSLPGPFALSTVYEYDPGLSGNIAITSPAGKLLRTWGEVKSE